MNWHRSVMCAIDTETTGVDVDNDRIITAAVVTIDPRARAKRVLHWVIDPGVEVPEEAARIHGYTTERVREEGRRDCATAISEIADAVMRGVQGLTPLLVYNAQFDLTLLDRETRRHGLEPLASRFKDVSPVVVDPLVLDKAVDAYRRGRRNLTAVSEHYGVPVGENAHGCIADALAAARIAYQLMQLACRGTDFLAAPGRYPRETAERIANLARMSLSELHQFQVHEKARQVASLSAYLKRKGEARTDLRPEWPIIPIA